ncbi:MAG TPA: hypothetical protein VJS44_04755 [Pyrinomonadaceae bacterium]|nr:hypothetical protein [Pyrinomonadaceae bacterium]
MSKLERPAPPIRREVELEQRPLYQTGSQKIACQHSGEDEGEFSRQIDPERHKPQSNLFRIIQELYGDAEADRQLRAQGKPSNITWGKVAIIVQYVEKFTGCQKPTPKELRDLTANLSDAISETMKQLPELSYTEQWAVTEKLVRVANELANAANAWRDGLRFKGVENSPDGQLHHSEHLS